MTRSKRAHEGVLMIDHRASPGIPDQHMPGAATDMPVRYGQGLFEAATYTCGHCPQVVLLNPLRTRDRGYCRKCDHYICDRCDGIVALTMTCVPYQKVLDEAQELAFQQLERGKSNEQAIIISTDTGPNGIR